MTVCADYCERAALPGRSRCADCWEKNLRAYESELGWKMPELHPCADCSSLVVNPAALRCRSCARKAWWRKSAGWHLV